MAEGVAAPLELGTKKISTLLRMYAVPGIIAQTAASLYNMVDSIYIGHIPGVGSYAISGLAVTFPLMNLSIALGTLVGVGAMTMISGFATAIFNMHPHESGIAYMTSDFGYQASGSGNGIPEFCPLIFEISIVDKP